MAHYAILDDNNLVINVITGRDEESDVDWEQEYSNITGKTALRTSFNTVNNQHRNGKEPFRGNFASIGYSYDATNNVFIPPKPYPSWVWNLSTCSWEAPVAHGDKGEGIWYWLETDPEKEGYVQGWNFSSKE